MEDGPPASLSGRWLVGGRLGALATKITAPSAPGPEKKQTVPHFSHLVSSVEGRRSLLQKGLGILYAQRKRGPLSATNAAFIEIFEKALTQLH